MIKSIHQPLQTSPEFPLPSCTSLFPWFPLTTITAQKLWELNYKSNVSASFCVCLWFVFVTVCVCSVTMDISLMTKNQTLWPPWLHTYNTIII